MKHERNKTKMRGRIAIRRICHALYDAGVVPTSTGLTGKKGASPAVVGVGSVLVAMFDP
jgi:hypothetical protein